MDLRQEGIHLLHNNNNNLADSNVLKMLADQLDRSVIKTKFLHLKYWKSLLKGIRFSGSDTKSYPDHVLG